MWAKDNYSKNNRIVAHQYKIRKQKEMEERDSLTFNPNNVSLNKTKIEVIRDFISIGIRYGRNAK